MVPAHANRPPLQPLPNNLSRCFGCGDANHRLDQCQQLTAAQITTAQRIVREYQQARRKIPIPLDLSQPHRLRSLGHTDSLLLSFGNDQTQFSCCADTGTSVCVMPSSIAQQLKLDLVEIVPVSFALGGDVSHVVCATSRTTTDVILYTMSGKLLFRAIEFFVVDASVDILLGDAWLKSVGIDVGGQLASLAASRDANDISNDMDITPDLDITIGQDTEVEINAQLHALVTSAVRDGLPEEHSQTLTDLVFEFKDIFRIKLGLDPPANVEPLCIHLPPDTPALKCKVRNYSPAKQEFMASFYEELCDVGLMYVNGSSQYSSPAHPVQKDTSFRSTVDYRQLNHHMPKTIWPMPMLDTFQRILPSPFSQGLSGIFFGYDS
jgi:hypothetical protein